MVRSKSRRRYGEPVIDDIRRRLAAGEPLREICAGEAMPAVSTVRRWRRTMPAFAARADVSTPALPPPRSKPFRVTDALLGEICRRLAEGEFLTAICRDRHMPARQTVHQRVRSDPAFRDRYAEARALQVEHLFEQIVAIADEDDNPARSRLRIEARKWLVVKLDPDRFGDKPGNNRPEAPGLAEELEKGRGRVGHDE